MRVREAKDFLVQQVAEQAAIENVPLSDLEMRMLYFTESGECPEDPLALNEAFEAKHDADTFEKKISHLMQHAYKRLRTQNAAGKRTWDDAIGRLKRGDHYLLVMWDERPSFRGVDLAVIVLIVLSLAAFAGLKWITRRFQPPNAHLIQGVLVTALVLGYIFRDKMLDGFDWLMEKTVFRFMKD